jgi:predicted nuclease of predicted toxin-antitoxin system
MSPWSDSTRQPTRIWTYAGERGFVIVSKDSDFRQLAFLHGPPPKAIWVRLGNAYTIEIFDALRDNHDEILRFGEYADEALLVLPRVSIGCRWNGRSSAVG